MKKKPPGGSWRFGHKFIGAPASQARLGFLGGEPRLRIDVEIPQQLRGGNGMPAFSHKPHFFPRIISRILIPGRGKIVRPLLSSVAPAQLFQAGRDVGRLLGAPCGFVSQGQLFQNADGAGSQKLGQLQGFNGPFVFT
jgi:hypothetical protein